MFGSDRDRVGERMGRYRHWWFAWWN